MSPIFEFEKNKLLRDMIEETIKIYLDSIVKGQVHDSLIKNYGWWMRNGFIFSFQQKEIADIVKNNLDYFSEITREEFITRAEFEDILLNLAVQIHIGEIALVAIVDEVFKAIKHKLSDIVTVMPLYGIVVEGNAFLSIFNTKICSVDEQLCTNLNKRFEKANVIFYKSSELKSLEEPIMILEEDKQIFHLLNIGTVCAKVFICSSISNISDKSKFELKISLGILYLYTNVYVKNIHRDLVKFGLLSEFKPVITAQASYFINDINEACRCNLLREINYLTIDASFVNNFCDNAFILNMVKMIDYYEHTEMTAKFKTALFLYYEANAENDDIQKFVNFFLIFETILTPKKAFNFPKEEMSKACDYIFGNFFINKSHVYDNFLKLHKIRNNILHGQKFYVLEDDVNTISIFSTLLLLNIVEKDYLKYDTAIFHKIIRNR